MTKFTSSFSAMATIILFQSGIQAQNLAENLCGNPGDSCMNKENYEYCTMLIRRGCRRRDMLVLESCPVQFMCTEKLLDELIDDACTTQNVKSDDGYDKCYDLCKDKDRVCNDSRYDSRDAQSFRQSDRESFRETDRDFLRDGDRLSTRQRSGSSDSSRDRSIDRSRSYDSRDRLSSRQSERLSIYQRNGSSTRSSGSSDASRDRSRDDESRDRSSDLSSDTSSDRSRSGSSYDSRDRSTDRSRDSSSNIFILEEEDCNAYRSCSVLGLDGDIETQEDKSNDFSTNSFSGSQTSNFGDDDNDRESDSPDASIFFGRTVSSILAVYYLFS